MCQDLPAKSIATAQLLVSELVTNAVVHAKGPIGLRISRDEGRVRVEVSDVGAAQPAQPPQPIPDPPAEAGRGFFLLNALASAWGTRPADRHGRETTWFELV
jgi:anti-sigma regulatory factor (Ser/Thr protein kinase)